MFIETAVVMSGLTIVEGYFLWQKLPRQVRRFLQSHELLTDLGIAFLTYVLLGSSVTALLAGGLVGVMTSICLYIASHPEEFEWLFKLYNAFKVEAQSFIDANLKTLPSRLG